MGQARRLLSREMEERQVLLETLVGTHTSWEWQGEVERGCRVLRREEGGGCMTAAVPS